MTEDETNAQREDPTQARDTAKEDYLRAQQLHKLLIRLLFVLFGAAIALAVTPSDELPLNAFRSYVALAIGAVGLLVASFCVNVPKARIGYEQAARKTGVTEAALYPV